MASRGGASSARKPVKPSPAKSARGAASESLPPASSLPNLLFPDVTGVEDDSDHSATSDHSRTSFSRLHKQPEVGSLDPRVSRKLLHPSGHVDLASGSASWASQLRGGDGDRSLHKSSGNRERTRSHASVLSLALPTSIQSPSSSPAIASGDPSRTAVHAGAVCHAFVLLSPSSPTI